MSVMNKPDYKIFAKDAKSGELVTFPDILRGWGVTLEQYNGFPPMELFNSAAKRIDEWLMYLTQRGLPEWDVAVDYPKDATIQHAGVHYVALKASKNEQPNNSQASWKKLTEILGVDGKLDKSSVVQTTGTSTTSVISQKKVTDELNTKASTDDLSSGLSKKVDYGNHAITGGVDSAGNGSVNAANGGIRFYRKKDGTLTLYSREEADGESAYVSEVSLPRGKGEACIDVFTFAAGGVKYRDVKSQRKNAATYTNTLARPILVIVSYDSPATRTLAYVDGVRVAQTSHGSPSATGAWGGFVSFIVPAGSKYIVNSNGDKIELLDWVEL